MRIQAARAVIVVMLVVVVFLVGMAVLAEVAQLQACQRLHGDRGLAAAAEHPWQEALHVWADPVQQVGIAHSPHVRRAQCVVVRRGAGRQQHVWAAHAVLYGGGNLLQGLDTGQHAHVGLRRAGDECDKKHKESGHVEYSTRQKQVT
ncbi:hypothetical protein D3C76_1370150 [compost metagenome]